MDGSLRSLLRITIATGKQLDDDHLLEIPWDKVGDILMTHRLAASVEVLCGSNISSQAFGELKSRLSTCMPLSTPHLRYTSDSPDATSLEPILFTREPWKGELQAIFARNYADPILSLPQYSRI